MHRILSLKLMQKVLKVKKLPKLSPIKNKIPNHRLMKKLSQLMTRKMLKESRFISMIMYKTRILNNKKTKKNRKPRKSRKINHRSQTLSKNKILHKTQKLKMRICKTKCRNQLLKLLKVLYSSLRNRLSRLDSKDLT